VHRATNHSVTLFAAVLLGTLACSSLHAQEIDAASHRSIVASLQAHIAEHPSVFPLESYTGGVQSFSDGLQYPYFGYGERRYSHRTDFHPAIDVAYVPLEVGEVKTVYGKTRTVRAPQTYLKRVYAIQEGVLESVSLKSSGYKVILRHTLEQPYVDSKGRTYHEFYTCYRHLDARSIAYLSLLARRVTNNDKATYEDVIDRYVFEAGEILGFVGFPPAETKTPPRAHLDFSLNLFSDPDKGQNIRDYSLNPLLLFPPFDYASPYVHSIRENGVPAYQFVVDESEIVAPKKRRDGRVQIEMHAGGTTDSGAFAALRYFALNAMQITIVNDAEILTTFTVDRHRKLGYNTSSYGDLDEVNEAIPHFAAPLDEQGDIFRMEAIIPARWLKKVGYDWSKSGSISIVISSIWDGYLDGHRQVIEIPLT